MRSTLFLQRGFREPVFAMQAVVRVRATFAETEHDCGVNVIIHVKERQKCCRFWSRVETGGCGRNCGGFIGNKTVDGWMLAGYLALAHPGPTWRSVTVDVGGGPHCCWTTWAPLGGAVSQATRGVGRVFRGGPDAKNKHLFLHACAHVRFR